MSLGDREDEANDDAEPEDLPNLVRRERQSYRARMRSATCRPRCILRWTGRQVLFV